jgi:hypothetical protein
MMSGEDCLQPAPIDPFNAEIEQSCYRLAARYRRKGDFDRAHTSSG